jgi:hypothetical protein
MGYKMRYIPLRDGGFAMVDSEDYQKLMIFEWIEHKSKYTSYAYAKPTTLMKEIYPFLKHRGYRSKNYIGMPYLILGKKPGFLIDHEDHNGLNNQKSNLRHATNRQNNANQRILKKEFKGTYKVKEGKYRATCDGVYLGTFNNKDLAAKAYDLEAVKRFGKFAFLNFRKTLEDPKNEIHYLRKTH